MKNQRSCTHFLCEEAPTPLILWVRAWALRLGANQSSVPDSNPAFLCACFCSSLYKKMT